MRSFPKRTNTAQSPTASVTVSRAKRVKKMAARVLVRASFSTIEALEERRMLANIPVTTGADLQNGNPAPGSLRAAIVAANAAPGSTITFATLPANTTITLTESLEQTPITGANTTIDGTTATSGQVTVNGGGFDGLDIAANNVTIQGLWLKNMGTAILIDGAQDAIVQGNYIGDVTNSGTGKNAIGVDITDGSAGDTIGGTDASEINVISGNSNSSGGGVGVLIEDPTVAGTELNVVEGNYIGTDATGSSAAPNDFGVVVNESSGNTIQFNTISGNVDDAVLVQNTTTNAYQYEYDTSVTSNIIGLDATGENPIPNGAGIFNDGGLSIAGDTVTGNTIEFNTGIGVETNEQEETIANNTIANNGLTGVVVDDDGVLNTITQNSIYLNGASGPAFNLGIDLNNDGVTANTSTSGTTYMGPNGLQSYPVIGTIAVDPNDSTQLSVPFTLQSNPTTDYTIEVFASEPANASPSGFGQGQIYVDSTVITTDANGAASGSLDISAMDYAGMRISATATNSDPFNINTNQDGGSTSEFSKFVIAPGMAVPTVTITGGSAGVGGTILFPITLSSASSTPVTLTYTINPGTAPLTDINTAMTGITGTITFPVGTTRETITLPVVKDTTGNNESFTVTLSQLSSNALFADLQSTESATGTILASASGTTTSSIVLTAAPTNAPSGTAVVLTATVSGAGGTPTGTVTFLDGATVIGSAPVNASGVASITVTTLPVGTDPISAVYSGSGTYSGSTSNTVVVIITGATLKTSSITLSANPTAAGFGATITFTATVTGSGGGPTPTGQVQFSEGGTVIGTSSLTGGKATFKTTTLPVGSDVIVATFLGSGTYSTSTSNPVTVVISATGSAATSTLLSAAPTTSGQGSSIKFTATVSASAAGGATPTGVVTFMLNGAAIGSGTLDAAGVATFSSTGLPIGSDTVTAVYAGDTGYAGSTSNPVTVTITPPLASTSITLAASATTIPSGDALTLTATVTHASGSDAPTGTVTFELNGVTLGTAVLGSNGSASITISTLAAGNNRIIATYGGNTEYLYSASTPLNILVTSTATTTLAASTNSVIVLNDSVVFTAFVASATAGGATPSGTVSFYQRGNVLLGTATVDSDGKAAVTTTSLDLGTDPITAVYSGENIYPANTSPTVTLTVLSVANSAAAVTTNVAVTSVIGNAVTLSVAVTPTAAGGATPTGTVTFSTNGILLGTATLLSNGTATFTTSALAVGNNTITAVYNGNSTYTASPPATTTAFLNTLGLVPVITKSTVPATGLVAGTLTHGALTLAVTNVTSALIREPQTTVHIYASANGTIDSNSVLVQQYFTGIKLKGGKTATFKLNVKALPVSLATGTYTLMIRISNTEGTFGYYFPGPTIQVTAARIAFSGTLSSTGLPATVVSGDNNGGFAKLTLTNNGNFTSSGSITIVLSASSTSGVAGTEIRSDTVKTVIAAGSSRTISIPLGLLPKLAAGAYYIVAQVTDPLGVTSLVTSPVSVNIATSFG